MGVRSQKSEEGGYEVDSVLEVYRGGSGDRRGAIAPGALRFPAGERLRSAIQSLRRMERPQPGGSQEGHPTGARRGQTLRRRDPRTDDGATPPDEPGAARPASGPPGAEDDRRGADNG